MDVKDAETPSHLYTREVSTYVNKKDHPMPRREVG